MERWVESLLLGEDRLTERYVLRQRWECVFLCGCVHVHQFLCTASLYCKALC